jgi:hypothetical protein
MRLMSGHSSEVGSAFVTDLAFGLSVLGSLILG